MRKHRGFMLVAAIGLGWLIISYTRRKRVVVAHPAMLRNQG